MSEDDYILATNKVRLRVAMEMLCDCSPSAGISAAQLAELRSKLARAALAHGEILEARK